MEDRYGRAVERMFVTRRNGWLIEGFAAQGTVDEVFCRVTRGHEAHEFASVAEAIAFADGQ